ncbi:MAG: ABC transporter ATP-binding protein [Flavobacteriales bacterium]
MHPNIFEAVNVRKQYGNYIALEDISIAVPKGSIFGLLGPNGAGKTSFIRIINQITAPDTGELFFNGQPLRPEHVERIGYLPEERGLYKKMEVGEQCLYLARLKGLSKEEAKRRLRYWFEKFEIQAWWNKKVEELSKGMAQKVQFIVTVLHEPELLIFDEPFSGFDPVNANLIKREILEISKKGVTIIFSTHRMDSVEELCDHIALINKSKKILDGRVTEIRDAYKNNSFEISFVGSVIAFTTALWAGAEILTKRSDDQDHHTFTIKLLGDNSVNDLLKALIPHVQITGLRESIPTMEEIFIKTVQN